MTHVAQMSAQLATQEKPLNSAWSREDNWVCTGVSVGCSRVNSSSKLLVSAVPFCGICSEHWQEAEAWANLRWLGSMAGECAYAAHRRSSRP